MNNIIDFTKYQIIKESKIPSMKFTDLLTNVDISNEVEKKVLITAFKCKLDFIDTLSTKKHLFRINDMAGTIMKNNRISFDSIIFRREQVEQIITNIVNYAIGEFKSFLPETITIFGTELKTDMFLNEELIKDTFEAYVTFDVALQIISDVTGFTLGDKVDKFYIWTKNK